MKILRVTEKFYFFKRFEYAQENIKNTWKEIKNVISNGGSTFSTINEINIDGILLDKTDEIATTFNNYFTNIGPKVANKIDPVTGSYLDYN